MFKPQIYAKAAMNKEQIAVKKSIGCSGIEIQLLNELKKPDGWHTLEEVFNIEDFYNEPVSVVHAPLLTGVGDMTIEQMADLSDCSLFYEVCRLANIFGAAHDKMITVVIHSETFLGFIGGIGETLNNIEKMIDQSLNTYEYVKIGIENVSPLRDIGKGGNLHLSNNFRFDNVELVQRIRKDLMTGRVGTVLDTCHAMLADKYISCLYREVADRAPEDLSMNRFFYENQPVCFLIHLAGMKGSGYGKGRHGTPFRMSNPADVITCNSILSLYDRYEYSCPITLEVEETDFSICDGYRDTKEIVDKYFEGE